MAGVRIEITARGLEDVEACLADLQRKGRDLTPFFNGVGPALLRSTKARFDARAGPDGTPWAPLSEATKARKRRNKEKILVHEGELKESSLSFEVDRDSLKLGSDKNYAGTHQFGRAANSARPFIGLSDEDVSRIDEILGNYRDSA